MKGTKECINVKECKGYNGCKCVMELKSYIVKEVRGKTSVSCIRDVWV